jgi:hypothetical protein
MPEESTLDQKIEQIEAVVKAAEVDARNTNAQLRAHDAELTVAIHDALGGGSNADYSRLDDNNDPERIAQVKGIIDTTYETALGHFLPAEEQRNTAVTQIINQVFFGYTLDLKKALTEGNFSETFEATFGPQSRVLAQRTSQVAGFTGRVVEEHALANTSLWADALIGKYRLESDNLNRGLFERNVDTFAQSMYNGESTDAIQRKAYTVAGTRYDQAA